jgi:hypothetical protein
VGNVAMLAAPTAMRSGSATEADQSTITKAEAWTKTQSTRWII